MNLFGTMRAPGNINGFGCRSEGEHEAHRRLSLIVQILFQDDHNAITQDYPKPHNIIPVVRTTATKFEQQLRHDDGDGNHNSICDGDADEIDDDNDDSDDDDDGDVMAKMAMIVPRAGRRGD